MYSRASICQHLSRPSRSVRAEAIREPMAAPRTPKEVMFAFLLARPEGLSTHFPALR